MQNKLLPCPFCGGHADIVKFPDNSELDNTRIYCTKCQCRTDRVCESMAIKQWNTRVNPELDRYKTALDIARKLWFEERETVEYEYGTKPFTAEQLLKEFDDEINKILNTKASK